MIKSFFILKKSYVCVHEKKWKSKDFRLGNKESENLISLTVPACSIVWVRCLVYPISKDSWKKRKDLEIHFIFVYQDRINNKEKTNRFNLVIGDAYPVFSRMEYVISKRNPIMVVEGRRPSKWHCCLISSQIHLVILHLKVWS